MMKPIQSRDNPTFRHLRALAEDARYRRAEAATLLDGVHLVQAACAAGASLRRVVVTAQSAQTREIRAVLDALPAECECIELAENLFKQLSTVDTPTGIVAEFSIPAPVASIAETADILLLEAVQDAGNLGTLLRTAAAAGVRQVLLSEACAQAWSPKVLRAGMGAHFVLSIREHVDLLSVLDEWRGNVMATALDVRAENLFALDLRGPVAWLFGSEGQGLSDAMLARASHLVRIPMASGSESLNVAAAAAVCLFEQLRQRSL